MQSLSEENVPGFMSNLRQAAEKNNVEITQSAPTVRTIVEILFKIPNFLISQNVTIDEPVIKVCLFSY